MSMNWTKTKPTQTGWYWYRGKYDAKSIAVQPVVTHVNIEGSLSGYYERVPYAWQPFMDYDGELNDFTGEWAGPIEPPAT
jgi:hypothetical protein